MLNAGWPKQYWPPEGATWRYMGCCTFTGYSESESRLAHRRAINLPGQFWLAVSRITLCYYIPGQLQPADPWWQCGRTSAALRTVASVPSSAPHRADGRSWYPSAPLRAVAVHTSSFICYYKRGCYISPIEDMLYIYIYIITWIYLLPPHFNKF